jgi:hypothetical protein
MLPTKTASKRSTRIASSSRGIRPSSKRPTRGPASSAASRRSPRHHDAGRDRADVDRRRRLSGMVARWRAGRVPVDPRGRAGADPDRGCSLGDNPPRGASNSRWPANRGAACLSGLSDLRTLSGRRAPPGTRGPGCGSNPGVGSPDDVTVNRSHTFSGSALPLP